MLISINKVSYLAKIKLKGWSFKKFKKDDFLALKRRGAMRESNSRLNSLFRTSRGRCLILWSISGILLIIALFSGFGEPILPYIVNQKIDEVAKPKNQQSVYDSWYKGEKAIAELQGRKFEDPREKKQPSLIWSWKWWIAFGISFGISFIHHSIILTERASKITKRALIEIKEKIKELIATRKRKKD